MSEDSSGVTFAFADGSTYSARLLIGGDGIHSKVSEYSDPGVLATYFGFFGVTYAFARSKIRYPPDQGISLPVSTVARNGAYILAPQGANDEEYPQAGSSKSPSLSAWDRIHVQGPRS